MKKYIIKNADGSEQLVMPAVHESRKEALLTILDYAIKIVEDDEYDSHCEEIFKHYIICPEDIIDVNKVIPDLASAIKFLQSKGSLRNNFFCNLSPERKEVFKALNQLFTIAEAWNTMDGFTPDFSDWNQDKWFPWFKYDKDAAGFVCAATDNTPALAHALIGSWLCFKTSERAAQFGKQFTDLYNKVFL